MVQNKKDSKKESAIDRLRESQEKLDQLDVPDFTTKSISFDQGDQSLKNIQKVINELVEEKKSTKTMRSALGNVRECFESAKNNRTYVKSIKIEWEE